MIRFLSITTLLALSAHSFAAAYLHLEGIDGESKSARHSKWIEIQSFSFGVSKTTNTPPNFSELHLSKTIDKASPKLFLRAANGQIFKHGVLEVFREGPRAARILQVKFLDCFLSSIAQSGGGGDAPHESFSLQPKSYSWTYTEIAADGNALRDISSTWSLTSASGSGGDIPSDSDNDGLPDDFERLHLLDLNSPDADEDPDKDGMTNIEEFRAGTAPNSPDSIFRVSGERTATGDASLAWQPATGKTYRLMGASSPDQPFEFVRFLTEEEASAGQLSLPPAGSFRFFILEVE
jgi:type VI secretion system secreted protein Hcp